MTTEPMLPFYAKKDADLAARIDQQVHQLLSNGAWWTARTLAQSLQNARGMDRALRIVAERSQGRIISGQKGYKLTRFATVEEIDHAERWLLSQARKMQGRAVEIRRARNSAAA